MRRLFAAALAAATIGFGPALAQQAPPQWYLDDIKALSAAGGRWIADNAQYKNEQEQFESYATEWRSEFDGHTMSGRLFGFKDGKETSFDFWSFRQYWHPGRNEAVVEQFGWGGALGVGPLTENDGGTMSDQTFYNADGSVTRVGHKSRFLDENTYLTESFDIVDGEWKPRRSYQWKRVIAK
ncbi:MAG TPA: hypothetical protein PKM48_14780 [Parvularculaceae bacterium]|nr:hypothetical protein [Parvularculaceae bacterium]HNS85810.1 hypothetical protein [Parvularculaceae bacterium]